MLLLNQSTRGTSSLAGICTKFVAVFMCFHEVTSLHPDPELNSAYSSSNNTFSLWFLNRGRFRSKPILEPVQNSFEEINIPAETNLFLKHINNPNASTTTPKEFLSASEVPSNESLRTAFVTAGQSEKQVPNVTGEKVTQTLNLLYPSTNLVKDELESSIDASDTDFNRKVNTVFSSGNDWSLPTHPVPNSAQNTATVPNSQSVISRQEYNSDLISSSSPTSSHVSSSAAESGDAKTSSNIFSDYLPTVAAVQGDVEDSVDSAVHIVATDSSENNAKDNKDYLNTQTMSSSQHAVGAIGDVSSEKRSAFTDEFAKEYLDNKRPLDIPTLVSKQPGLPDYSSGEDTEVPKEDTNRMSDEDYSDPVIIVSTDDRGNVFGMATTRKPSTAKTSMMTFPLTSPASKNDEKDRPATRRRGGRKRNRKRSTTVSVSSSPTSEVKITADVSSTDGTTLRWTVATPMPEWEEKHRRTRDAESENETGADSVLVARTVPPVMAVDGQNKSEEKKPEENDMDDTEEVAISSSTDGLTEVRAPLRDKTENPDTEKGDKGADLANTTIVEEITTESTVPPTTTTMPPTTTTMPPPALVECNVTSTTYNSAVIEGKVVYFQEPEILIKLVAVPPKKSFEENVMVEADGSFKAEFKNIASCTNYTVQFPQVSTEKATNFRTNLGVAPAVNDLVVKASHQPENTAVEVTWNHPTTECWSDIDFYNVSVKKTSLDDEKVKCIVQKEDQLQCVISASDLKYNTNYTIKVAAVVNAQPSPIMGEPNVTTVLTRMQKPRQPSDIKLTPCSHSIDVSFVEQLTSDSVVSYYQYCYNFIGQTCDGWTNVTNLMDYQQHKEFKIFNLQADTNYNVAIRAVSVDEGLSKDKELFGEKLDNSTKTQVNELAKILETYYTVDGVNVILLVNGVTQGPTKAIDYQVMENQKINVDVLNEKFTFKIQDLNICTNYTLEVWPVSYCSETQDLPSFTQPIRTPLGAVNLVDLIPVARFDPDAESATIDVSWTPPVTKCLQDIIRYEVSWSKTNGTEKIIKKNATDLSITLPVLEFFTSYTINVVVVTQMENSSEVLGGPNPTEIVTRMARPTAPKIKRDDFKTCSQHIIFEFEEITNWTRGVINHYEYSHSEEDISSLCDTATLNWETLPAFQKNVTVPELKPDTNYVICLRAVSHDEGYILNGTADEIALKTFESVSIPIASATNWTTNSAHLVGKTTGPISTVSWQLRSSSRTPGDGLYQDNTFDFNITNLDDCTLYIVDILAKSNCSQQMANYTVPITTLSPLPPPVRNLTATAVESRSANINWFRPDFHCNITNYIITYHPLNNSHENESANVSQINYENVSLDYLYPYTNYNVSVVAVTDSGTGLHVESIDFTTSFAEPAKPTDVEITDCTSKVCNLTWTMPVAENGPRQFNIQCNLSDTNFDFPDKVARNNTSIQFTSRLNELLAYTDYVCNVSVRIQDFIALSELSSSVKTRPDIPKAPTEFKVACGRGADPGKAEWVMPPISNGIVQNFTISYHGSRDGDLSSDCTNSFSKDSSDSGNENYEVSTPILVAECNYSFTIVAYNRDVADHGEVSEVRTCFQKAKEPPLPRADGVKQIDGKQNTISFTKDLFSEENGKIQSYSMIMYAGSKRSSLKDVELKNWQAVYYKDVVEPYVVTQPGWNPFAVVRASAKEKCCHLLNDLVECELGCDTSCGNEVDKNIPCNGPLQPDTTYYVVIRATTNGGFTDTEPVEIKSGETSKSAVNATLGVSLALLAIIVVAGVFIHYRRNDFRKLFFIKPSVERETQTSSLQISNRTLTRPENIADFQNYYLAMAADSGLKFSQEYEELKAASPVLPTTVANLLENRCKNRWINILPFDQSRVKLLPISDDVTTDYINACYIPGVNSPREYIATQGPLPGTKDDFWRMVWEQSSQMIVMVTQLVERGKVKCEQYWPNDRDVHHYGDLAVQLRSESILSGFTIRIFDLNLGTKSLEVKQMHFTKWPDFGCPENTSLLINFVQAVREHMPHEILGPIIVHCSAGVGRTGTFIAVDRLIQHLQTQDYVDIYGIVLDMRNYRTNMVQTEDQYVYIHECIRDILLTAQESTDDGEVIYENFAAITKNRDSQL